MALTMVTLVSAVLLAQQPSADPPVSTPAPAAELPVALPAAATPVAPWPTPKSALTTRLDRVRADNADIPVPTKVEVQNRMGNRFRLVEAALVIDGARAAHRQAPQGGELNPSLSPFSVLVPAGNHVLTATLVFAGRNVGPFTYMDDTRYRVESTIPFVADHVKGAPTIRVVASERPGANVPFEKRPLLSLSVENHPAAVTQPTNVAVRTETTTVPPAEAKIASTPASSSAPALVPARATTRTTSPASTTTTAPPTPAR